jgi:hypothetical protein
LYESHPLSNIISKGIGVSVVSQERIRLLLSELQLELARTGDVEEETLSLMRKLEQDIEQLIETSEQRNSPVLDDAIALEARFAATHPTAEKLLREVIDSLARIGI